MYFQLNHFYIFFTVCKAPYIDRFNTYETPAADDSFDRFTITDTIPSDGKHGAGPSQRALTITKYERYYITFNFKGNGNAQVLLQEYRNGSDVGVFTVVIGEGANNSKVTIYRSKLLEKLNETTLEGITSGTEFRSFWISIEPAEEEIAVGLCHDPYRNQILSAWHLRDLYMENIELSSIALSTTSDNGGQWQFSSNFMILGGCLSNDEESCFEGFCITVYHSRLHGTCVPYSLHVSDAAFGNGKCRADMMAITKTSLLTTAHLNTQALGKTTREGMLTSARTTIWGTHTVGQDEHEEGECSVEIVAAIVGGTVGSMAFLGLVIYIFYTRCTHIFLAKRRGKVEQDNARRELTENSPQSSVLAKSSPDTNVQM